MDNKSNALKRKREDDDDTDEKKKKSNLETSNRVETESNPECSTTLLADSSENTRNEVLPNDSDEEGIKSGVGIDNLSDDVLLVLLSYLNSSDIVNISLCTRRLYNICADKTLWNKVNFMCDGKAPSHNSILSYLHSGTTSLRFHKMNNENSLDTCFGKEFFQKLGSFKNVKMLAIENHVLTPQTLTLKFVPHVTELKLEGTQIVTATEGQEAGFFCKFDTTLPNLETLDVSYCQWFQPHLLVPLAKCPHLKVLKMKGCRNMRDFIPYASVAAAFGYRKLETLDMRLTNVVDREIGCFNKVKSLKHIFLERPQNVVGRNEDDDESITDICTTSLGMRNWHSDLNGQNRVLICRIPSDGGTASDHTLETLVVRNYPRITDITLKHAEKCLKSLKYLDVTGSSCSREQVARFRANRPEVTLLYHDAAVQLQVAG